MFAMAAKSSTARFIVWGKDQTPCGPVDLDTLVAWIQDGRITADMWIFAADSGVWRQAAEVPELGRLFPSRPGPTTAAAGMGATPREVETSTLRRIRILAGMTDEQLERLARFVEVESVPAGLVIVRQGERDDTLYLILEGELRVRLEIVGRETVLARLSAGDFFGDIAFLDRGPRSADVVANTHSLVAKITGPAFDQLAREALDLATPLLRALDQTLTARIRADNQRYREALRRARTT